MSLKWCIDSIVITDTRGDIRQTHTQGEIQHDIKHGSCSTWWYDVVCTVHVKYEM